MTVYTLRHCCHNCYHFRKGFTLCYDEFYECLKHHTPNMAEESVKSTNCKDFAINTNDNNLIFDEDKDNG